MSRKYCPCIRLPWSRPCMSVKATMTVSTRPSPIAARRSSRLRCLSLRVMAALRLAQEPAQERGRVVAVLFHRPAGFGRLAGDDRRDDGAVLCVGMLDVDSEDRDRLEHVVQ